jgi:AraC family transcriptional regulator
MSPSSASSLETDAPAPGTELIVDRLCWVHHVIALPDAAVSQRDHQQAVHGTVPKATSLLRKQSEPEVEQELPDRRGGLRAWQARTVLAYIDSHIAGPVLVAGLCALVQLSEAHFSRAFRRTFGKSPHAFLIRRRVELAAQYMLQTEAPLSDIALECGFTDQPHLCKHFRHLTGHTPAAWRRAHSGEDAGDRPRGPPRFIEEQVRTERFLRESHVSLETSAASA